MSALSRIGFHFILFVTGLLNETGHERVYPVDIARRTRFIQAAQALGLTPDEAREFLRTPVRCGPTRDPGPLSKPKTDTRNAIAVGLCSLSHTSRGRAVTRPAYGRDSNCAGIHGHIPQCGGEEDVRLDPGRAISRTPRMCTVTDPMSRAITDGATGSRGTTGHPGWAIFAHSLLRIASSADGVLVGLFLAGLSRENRGIQAALAGLLGATAYGAELIASTPLGLAADVFPARGLMPLGALTSALGTRLFTATVSAPIFFVSRALLGLGVAAVTPPLLGFLAQSTRRESRQRARVMSFFELSMLAGIALGGLVGSQLWTHLGSRAFGAVALLEASCALLLFLAVRQTREPPAAHALRGLREVLRHPLVRRLAPSWVLVNAVVGLWLGPTLTFLLTEPPRSGQYLDGLFAQVPGHIGWLMLSYTAVFGVGVSLWSIVLPKIRPIAALRVSLYAMLGASLALYAVNHSTAWGSTDRSMLLAVTALLVMIESGFTPAALSLLAHSLEAVPAKGAAMGIYSTLLGLGAVAGSLLAAALGTAWQVDGLLVGTVMIAGGALLFLRRVPPQASAPPKGPEPANGPHSADGSQPGTYVE